jgi:hypothetical protein
MKRNITPGVSAGTIECVSFYTQEFRGNLTLKCGVISVDTVQPWTFTSGRVSADKNQGGL